MTRVFLSTWGESDNIGDSILRRGLLRTFQTAADAEIHVHIGRKQTPDPNDDRYIAGLGLRGNEVVYDGTMGWLGSYAASVMGRRTMLVMPAGEIMFPERTRFYWGWWTALFAAMPLLRGGSAVQVGAGVRMSSVGGAAAEGTRVVRSSVKVPALERFARRKMSVIGWRDAGTQISFQVGDVVPDWAFGEGPDPQTEGLGAPPRERGILAVTMRSDRNLLSDDKIRLLRGIADARGLQIQVYSQVRRDRKNMEELARVLHPDREALLFGDESHADWEKEVRALHRQSAIVASDRLHGLIIGATEGAIPLAISNWTTEKAIRTLKPGGFELPAECPDAIKAYLDEMFADDTSVSTRVVTARTRLDAVRSRLQEFISTAPARQQAPAPNWQAVRNTQRRKQIHRVA